MAERRQSQINRSRLVEILIIDTTGSRNLYSKFNPEQKARAQALLKAQFVKSCKLNSGVIHTWNGDGGFSFFPSENQFGKSVEAAVNFLKNLKNLNYQTAAAMNVPRFCRHVRICAHRGEVFITNDPGLDSADPRNFDDFIKYEKKFSMEDDDFFITQSLYEQLAAANKEQFKICKKKIKAGSLITNLYRKSLKSTAKARNVLALPGVNGVKLSADEWRYLKSLFTNNHILVAARNKITSGLINLIDGCRPPNNPISSDNVFDSTFSALYNYLRSVDRDIQYRLSYWRGIKSQGKEYLKLVAYRYPPGEQPSNPHRQLRADDTKYKVCSCFKTKELLAIPCIAVAREAGEWEDFCNSQKQNRRELRSALQIPIFYRDQNSEKIMQGVLCLDANKSDHFASDETSLWKDDLVGFLINIAFSEKLRSYYSKKK